MPYDNKSRKVDEIQNLAVRFKLKMRTQDFYFVEKLPQIITLFDIDLRFML